MAICSGIIVLFFIQAFDGNQTALTLTQRWFVGILAATINYIYAELFYKKWSERNDLIQQPNRVNELQSNVYELQSTLVERERTLHERESALNESRTTLVELQRFKAKVDRAHTCPHCNVVQDSYGTLNAHKGHCSQNPKNKTP